MFSTSILDAMVTFGYVSAVLGFALCVIAYFAAPKMVKMIIRNDENDKE